MSDDGETDFRPGRNMAMKVPPHQFEATVAFYRNVLGLPHIESYERSECFSFGSMRLWIDRVDHLSQAEIWLEIQSDDTDKAARILETSGAVRCDDIESPKASFDGFWIANPAGIVHFISHPKEDPGSS